MLFASLRVDTDDGHFSRLVHYMRVFFLSLFVISVQVKCRKCSGVLFSLGWFDVDCVVRVVVRGHMTSISKGRVFCWSRVTLEI